MRPARNGIDNASVAMDAVTLTPSEAIDLVVGLYQTGSKRTPILRGSPGCGKTTSVRVASEKLREILNDPSFGYIEVNPTMPADEVGGIPDLIRTEGQDTVTDYALPQWFPRDPKSRGIICLDDALQGDRMMQQTLANLILARNLRNHPLPDGWMIVATGNRMEDKAGVTRTLTHLADRMCWINVAIDADSWIDDFATPKGIDERVIGYIMRNKAKLDNFDPNAEKSMTARTWEAVSGHLKYLDTLTGANKNKFAQAILGGELGIGEATAFWAFCGLWGKLPDIDALLKDPANAKIDYDLDMQYALTIAIGNRMDDTTFANGIEYITRLGPDLTTLAVKVAVRQNPKLTKSDAWTKWLVKNQDVVCAV